MAAQSQPDPMRRTKIVCTIGPATADESSLRALIGAGMNVARLNFSHGTREGHGQVIERIRRLTDEMGVAVAILQDLAGPKVRVGTFKEGSVELEAGKTFTLTSREVEGTDRRASVTCAGLPRDVKPGDRLLLADGSILLDVARVKGDDIQCQVVVGGTLSAHKGVNVPSGLLHLPILDDRDLADLAFGVEQRVDYIGLSFVRTAEDVRRTRSEVERCGGDIPIIAKIETQAALTHADAILDEADGIMIARGDLSIETPFARVPVVQKDLVAKAGQRAKPTITATQMLFSMVESPTPTRAEVADVANAVLDGSSAVMLSEETTVGKYPVQAVKTMASIVIATEQASRRLARPTAGCEAEVPFRWRTEAFALGACELAERLAAEVIATLTIRGKTARFVAKYRPTQAILAATPRPDTFRRLALIRGAMPLLLPPTARSHDDMREAAAAAAHSLGWKGKKIVIVSDHSIRSAEL